MLRSIDNPVIPAAELTPTEIPAIGRIFAHGDNIVPSIWSRLPREVLPKVLGDVGAVLAEKNAGPTDLALVDPEIAGDAVGGWGEVLGGHKTTGVLMTSEVLSALNRLASEGRDRDLAIVLAAIRQAGGIILGFEIEEKAGQRKLYLYA